jgi:hypothetical protein
MSPNTDPRRRTETPPAFGDAFPAGLRSEAFAEDLADLLVPAPSALPSARLPQVVAPLRWFGHPNVAPPALGV